MIDWNNPPKQKSIEDQIGSLTKEEKDCFDELRKFWDNDKMEVKYSDYQILRFARCSPGKYKFNPTTAKKVMTNYASWSKRIGLNRITIRTVRFELERHCLILPGIRDIDGNHVVYMKPAAFFPGKNSLNELLRSLVYLLESITEFEDACVTGICFMCNMENWGWSNFGVRYAKNFFDTLQGRFPLRVRKFLIIDPPSWFGAIWRLIRPMMSAEFAAKVKLPKLSEVGEHFQSLDEFPEAMGGKVNLAEQSKQFILYRYRVEGLDPNAPYQAGTDDGEDLHEDKVEE